MAPSRSSIFRGQIIAPGTATAADVLAIVDGRISNSAATRTSGLDLLLHYDLSAGANNFGVELNANKVFRFDNKLTPSSPWIHTLNTPYNPIGFRARAGLTWNRGPFGAVGFLNYTAAYRDNRTLVVVPVHSFTTLDTGLSLNGSAMNIGWLKHLRFALNVQNLLDTKPPYLAPDPGNTDGLGYDPVNASGEGRFVSFQLRATW